MRPSTGKISKKILRKGRAQKNVSKKLKKKILLESNRQKKAAFREQAKQELESVKSAIPGMQGTTLGGPESHVFY